MPRPPHRPAREQCLPMRHEMGVDAYDVLETVLAILSVASPLLATLALLRLLRQSANQ
jgi:hypothetical protein